MSNTNSTDTSKTTPQRTPFVKNVEANDVQPAKVEAPAPSAETDRQAVGQQKQPVVDDETTSRR
jgi:hypothetical protein